MPSLPHKTLPLNYEFDDASLLGGGRLERAMRDRWRGLGIHVELQQRVWWTDNDDLLEQAIPRGASADIILALAERMARGRKAAQNPRIVIDFTDHLRTEHPVKITKVAAITGRNTRSLFEREPVEGTKVAEIGLYQVQTTTRMGRTEDHYYLVGGERDDLLVHEIDEGDALRLAKRLGAGEPHHEVFKVCRNADFEVSWMECVAGAEAQP